MAINGVNFGAEPIQQQPEKKGMSPVIPSLLTGTAAGVITKFIPGKEHEMDQDTFVKTTIANDKIEGLDEEANKKVKTLHDEIDEINKKAKAETETEKPAATADANKTAEAKPAETPAKAAETKTVSPQTELRRMNAEVGDQRAIYKTQHSLIGKSQELYDAEFPVEKDGNAAPKLTTKERANILKENRNLNKEISKLENDLNLKHISKTKRDEIQTALDGKKAKLAENENRLMTPQQVKAAQLKQLRADKAKIAQEAQEASVKAEKTFVDADKALSEAKKAKKPEAEIAELRKQYFKARREVTAKILEENFANEVSDIFRLPEKQRTEALKKLLTQQKDALISQKKDLYKSASKAYDFGQSIKAGAPDLKAIEAEREQGIAKLMGIKVPTAQAATQTATQAVEGVTANEANKPAQKVITKLEEMNEGLQQKFKGTFEELKGKLPKVKGSRGWLAVSLVGLGAAVATYVTMKMFGGKNDTPEA